ncbi:MAG: LacI family DNA-binding transcriptional regulator, partial [Verrucomicrobiota bacterium]
MSDGEIATKKRGSKRKGLPKNQPSSQAPRLIDIAKKLGVSVQAVSLVLKGQSGVGQAMSEKILKESQRLGYRRNRFAAKFFSKKTKTIGVVIPRLAESWMGFLIEELHQYIHEIGFDMELFLTNYDSTLEEKVLNDLVGIRVDGIVLVSKYWNMNEIPSTHYLKTMRNESTMIPVVTSYTIEGSGVPAVIQDIYQGMKDAV